MTQSYNLEQVIIIKSFVCVQVLRPSSDFYSLKLHDQLV